LLLNGKTYLKYALLFLSWIQVEVKGYHNMNSLWELFYQEAEAERKKRAVCTQRHGGRLDLP
jgi:hypothetical protein